jgi:hypothetical protein
MDHRLSSPIPQGKPSKPGERIEIVVRIPEKAATKSAKWAGFKLDEPIQNSPIYGL